MLVSLPVVQYLFMLTIWLIQGYAPFAVVATSGTTILGAFDSLDSLADVCGKHELWLHVDVSNPSRLQV